MALLPTAARRAVAHRTRPTRPRLAACVLQGTRWQANTTPASAGSDAAPFAARTAAPSQFRDLSSYDRTSCVPAVPLRHVMCAGYAGELSPFAIIVGRRRFFARFSFLTNSQFRTQTQTRPANGLDGCIPTLTKKKMGHFVARCPG